MLKSLLKNDIKYLKTDPMMLVILFLPVILTVVYQVITRCIPVIEPYIIPYIKPLQYVLLTMGSSMVGVVMALRMLDDKDEHMLAFYAVSPLKLSGYFLYRGLSSVIIGVILTGIASLGILGKIQFEYLIYIGGLELLLTFGIGTLAKNKLQGMVCMKLTGLIVMLPCIRLLGENEMNWILKLQPWDYAYRLIVEINNNVITYIGYGVFIGGLCILLLQKGSKLRNV